MELTPYNVILWVLSGIFTVALFLMLHAAEMLKQRTRKRRDAEADIARFHSKPVGLASVVLIVTGIIVSNESEITPSVAWVPFLLIAMSGLLIAGWWYTYLQVIMDFKKSAMLEKHFDQLKRQKK